MVGAGVERRYTNGGRRSREKIYKWWAQDLREDIQMVGAGVERRYTNYFPQTLDF